MTVRDRNFEGNQNNFNSWGTMLKKIAFLATLLLLVGVGAMPASADGNWTFTVVEIGLQNYLESDMARGNTDNMVDGHCLALGVGDCDFATMQALNSNVGLHVNLPFCETTAQEYCIDSLQVYADGETPKDATFDFQTFTNHPQIQTDLAHGIPPVGNPLIFKSAGVTSVQGSDEFMVQASLDMQLTSPDYMAKISDFKMSVMPVAVGNGPDRTLAAGFSPEDFKPETRSSVKVRIPKNIGGWFKGRLSDAKVTIQDFSKKTYVLTVDAKSVQVPLAQMSVSAADCEAFQVALWGRNILGDCSQGGSGIEADGMFSLLEAMRPYTNDTAASMKTAWDVSSFSGMLRTDCLSTGFGLAALVATNATIFTGAAPDQDEKGLHYKVAGLHFLPDGSTVTQGNYDLLIREDVARCIYSLPADGNLYATVNVADGNKADQATTSFSVENGYAHFAANGFHFSQPVITTMLSNIKPVDGIPATHPKAFVGVKGRFSGKLLAGKTIKFTVSELPRSTIKKIQWYSGGKKIVGATGSALKVTKKIIGTKISVVLILNKAGYAQKKLTLRFN